MRLTITALALIFPAIIACVGTASRAAVVPAGQSKCEIDTIKYWAAHPNTDPIKALQAGFFYIPSIDAPPPEAVPDYHDIESGITFSVESGRQITAIASDGKVIWRRNPFVDSNMCPYRSPHPYIFWIGAPGGGFGRPYLKPFNPKPDSEANTTILKMLTEVSKYNHKYKAPRPRDTDRFIGVNFNSSQMGYLNIRTGDFYFMGQN